MKCLESTSHFYYSTESTHAALNGPPRAEPLPYATPFPLVLSSSHRRFRGLFCLQNIAGFFAFGKQSLEGNFILILFSFFPVLVMFYFFDDIATGFPLNELSFPMHRPTELTRIALGLSAPPFDMPMD